MNKKIKTVLAYIFIGVGIAGVLMPIIPGTPFLIAGLILWINRKLDGIK